MKRLFYAAALYTLIGLASGLYYRELTKMNEFTAADGFTQLSVVHTHLLVLGTLVLLIALVIEKVFTLSRSNLFGWFFWIYNLGLIVTTALMTVNGTLTVLGEPTSKALAGISGMGHMILTAGLVLFFLALKSRVIPGTPQETDAATSASTETDGLLASSAATR